MENWGYSDAAGTRVGLMMCEKCEKKIVAGEFRYYLDRKIDGYVTEHRSCSSIDKNWEALDRQKAEEEAEIIAIKHDCQVFADKYGIDADDVFDLVNA